MSKQAEYSRTWYARNKAVQKQRVHERRRAIREWLDELKSTLSCECGESDIRCLEFHHKNAEEKTVNISDLTQHGWGKKRILEEIEKCDILCANCHRKQTFS